jgi:rare lipoprotein A
MMSLSHIVTGCPRYTLFRLLALLLTLALLGGCSISSYDILEEKDGGPDRHVDINSIPNAVPKHEPRSRYGNMSSYEVFGKRYYTLKSSQGFKERGVASWYGNKFHGRKTSSGEKYNMYAMTAAHKTLPLPTYVEVSNLENGRQIIVKVNDRGPFHQNRIIDLSYVAAKKLGITRKGTGLVEVRAINPSEPYRASTVSTASIGSNNISYQPGLFIQAGAFKSRDNALRLKSKLTADLNRPVRISEAFTRGDTFYRVQVGPLVEVQVADQVSMQLENLGISNIKTVID